MTYIIRSDDYELLSFKIEEIRAKLRERSGPKICIYILYIVFSKLSNDVSHYCYKCMNMKVF